MLHAVIVLLLGMIAIVLYPVWVWSSALGYGPFVGALTILIVVVILRFVRLI